MKVLFINLKKNIISITFFLFTICLIIFSKSNIQAVKNSLNIWVNNVIPSLFIRDIQLTFGKSDDRKMSINRRLALSSLNISLTARGEELSAEEFIKLSEIL